MSTWLPTWSVSYLDMADAAHPLPSPVAAATGDEALRYRLGRLRAQLVAHDCPAILLYDPVNILYATGVSNMNVWMMHNSSHYALVFADGPVIDFAYKGSVHLAEQSAVVDEARVGTSFIYLYGEGVAARARLWAREIAAELRAHGGGSMRLAVDKVEPPGLDALRAEGVEVVEGQQLTEHARAIKSPAEIELMLWSVRVCEAGLEAMRRESQPGRTELEIWAELHRQNIRYGGEYIETRLLTTGPRTNPWFQEASHRVAAAGDMLAVDCDMVGPSGYCADISRSWTIGHTALTAAQRDLYLHAVEQIEHNTALLAPGMSFEEFNERSWRIPDRFAARNYGLALHGVGMADEWPSVSTHRSWGRPPFDPPAGEFQPGMVLCVESLMALDGVGESVKLETQVLITADGPVRLDQYPWEAT